MSAMERKRIKAELVLASKNAVTEDILYTFKLTFPRMILPEVNTHKIAAKNTSSSRAVPVLRMMRNVWKDPFVPMYWGTYKSGMQAGPPLTGWKARLARWVWKTGRLFDLFEAWVDYYILHLSKEITNRVYERYIWTEQLYSTTDLKNLLKLRDHPMAEPHFHMCASQINAISRMCDYVFGVLKDRDNHVYCYEPPWWKDIAPRCQILSPGSWHLPYAHEGFLLEQINNLASEGKVFWNLNNGELTTGSIRLEGIFKHIDFLKRISAGRCAWVSYFMPGQDSEKMDNLPAALSTYAKLAELDPKHLSPLEHQAVALPQSVRCGNFVGFMQFRKQIPGEAGGDKVVRSILPEEAEQLLREWELNKTWREEIPTSENPIPR